MTDNTLRVARLERSVLRLRLLVIATTCLALGAASTALVFALRTPAELAIGNTRVTAKGVAVYDGAREVNITSTGIYVGQDRGAIMQIAPDQLMMSHRNGTSLHRPSLLLVITKDRATVALEGPEHTAILQSDATDAALHLDGEPLR